VDEAAWSLVTDRVIGVAATPEPSEHHGGCLAEAGGDVEQPRELVCGGCETD